MCVLVCAIKMMTTIIVHRSITVAVLLLVIFGNIVISQRSVVQQQQQQAVLPSTAAAIKIKNSTTTITTSTTITSNSSSTSSTSSSSSSSPSSPASALASIKNLTPSSPLKTTTNKTTTNKTTTNKATTTTTTRDKLINKNKNETTSSEISIEVESVADGDDDDDVDIDAAAADDAVSRVVVVGGAVVPAAAAASHPANSTQILSTFEDVGPSSITPTTYRPLRPSIAPQTSAQDRERKLMNVLAARRTALHRGGYRTRIGTTGRTASASIETTPKTPTDPRSICIRNCTKNFTRRTTASCMRQCASFQRSAATANGTAIVVKASSKSGLGTQQRERDTNEILFTDESSHGLFVVAKELNGTANHISEGVGMKSSGGYKFKTRKKPPAALVVVTVAPPTSFEEDDIAPYLFFGQKLPPIRPAMLSITAVNNDHPKLLEVSVASSTPESLSSTLSAVERSRSRYKYNMRDRVNLPFNRRFSAAGQAEQRRNAMSSMGSETSTPSKAGGATTMTTPTTARTMPATAMMEETKHESLEIQNASFVRRAGDAVEEPQQSKVVPNLAAVDMVPSTSTPLIITVLSDEEEGATEVPRVDKSEVLKTKTATAPATTINTTKKSLKMATALTSSRSPEGTSTARTTTTSTSTSTSKPPARSTAMRTTTTTTTTRVPPPLPTLSPPSPAPSQAKSSSSLPTSHVPFLSPSPPSLATSPAPSLAPSPTSPTTTRTTSFTSSSPMTSLVLPKSIIEEDTERLRALGPSLTQEINTDDKTNLVIFVNRTSGPYVPHGDNQNNNNTDDDDDDGFSNLQPTRSPSRFRPHTDPLPTILHTTVLTSIRSTVNPRTTPRTPAVSPAAGAIPLAPTSVSTSGVGSDISSTVMTDEREVTVEIRRINMATYVLVGIGVLPLLAVIAFVMRNFIIRRAIKTDEVFDVCITDQQPISPVKKLSSKYRHEDEDDEDDVDHHHHHQQLQKQQQQTQQQQHHHHQHHRPIYRQHSMHQQKQPQPRDTNYNINIHCNNSINNNSGRYDEQCSVTSDQEFDRNNIRLKSLLGEGNFGHVWKAEADDLSGHFGATRIVAVKTVRAGSTQVGLKEEASIMRKLGSHQNVVTLLGACVESEPHMIIMEYAMRGRLLSLLRAARNATNILPASVPGGRSLTPLSPRTLSGFALDIACGMEYIAQRRIVHRDLAARNVLLDHNGICKICDFGMSLDLDAERQAKTLQKKQKQKEEEANEIMRSNSNKFKFDFSGRFIINHWSPNFGGNSNNSNTKTNNSQQQLKECSEKKSPRHTSHDTISRRPALPIRWMAPEALQYHVFTTETDIWAFGIVLWEIATLGSTPYSHFTGREVIRRVPGGLRPDIPKEGRHEFYNLMARCWHKEPQLRPSFTQARLEITRSLGKWVEDDSATSDYMDVSGFSEDMEHGMVYFNHRISEFECEI